MTQICLIIFDNLDAPSIASDKRKDLDEPLTLEEVIKSITAMRSGKDPGPDGHSIEFYKIFYPNGL